MSGGGTGWWGSMQPEVKWTPPYGVGNDFWGTLDIARMDECDITADTIKADGGPGPRVDRAKSSWMHRWRAAWSPERSG